MQTRQLVPFQASLAKSWPLRARVREKARARGREGVFRREATQDRFCQHFTAMRPCAHSFAFGSLGQPGFPFKPRNRALGALGGFHTSQLRTCRVSLQVVCEKAKSRCAPRPQPWREGARKRVREGSVGPIIGRRRERSRSQSHRGSARGSVKLSKAKEVRQVS